MSLTKKFYNILYDCYQEGVLKEAAYGEYC
jgi:hypothetical protein